MDEGTIVEWRVQPGDEVHRGDVVAIVETDKSDLDVEVFVDGVVQELVVAPGLRVPVGTVLAMILPTGRAARRSPAHVVTSPVVTSPVVTGPVVTSPVVTGPGPAPLADVTHLADRRAGAPPLRSPVLRHLADQLHVDVAHVVGSGPGGQLTRDDIERAGRSRPRITPRARRLAATHGIDLGAVVGDRPVTGDEVLRMAATQSTPPESTPTPASASRAAGPRVPGPPPPAGDTMRSTIARQMLRAWQEIPHFQVATTIELSRPLAELARLNEDRTAADRVLPVAMFVSAAARAAAQVPGVDGWWRDGAFEPAAGVHIGVVIALRRGGLLVPVVHDAHAKDLDTVMAELRDLVTRARAGRLRASEMSGASITLTQLGDGEVDTVVPIIHPPQVAIVGLGAVHDAPWVVGDAVLVRPVVRAVLAADHRAVDGRIGSSFLTALDRHLQEVVPS